MWHMFTVARAAVSPKSFSKLQIVGLSWCNPLLTRTTFSEGVVLTLLVASGAIYVYLAKSMINDLAF